MLTNNGIIILLTLLLSLIVSIIPMPLSIDIFRPDWVLVVLLYWSIALPNRVNIITASIMGFLLDVLLGSILGVHTAAMAISVYFAVVNFQKIRNFSLWQQSLIIGIITLLYHQLVFVMQYFLTDTVFLASYLYPVITSILVWPWAFLLLRKIRRQFQIK